MKSPYMYRQVVESELNYQVDAKEMRVFFFV